MFIKTQKNYEDKELFGVTNYPKELKYNNLNNLVVGKIKDETCGMPMKGFSGLKSKMYVFTTQKAIINVKKQKAFVKMLLMRN